MAGASVFDGEAFRRAAPAYGDPAKYPTDLLMTWWGFACEYLTAKYGGVLGDSSRDLAINLLAAHLLTINTGAAAPGAPGVGGIATASRVGDVSVAIMPPAAANAFQQFLSMSTYGMQVRALLRMAGVGGMYFAGIGGRAGMRGPYG